MAKAKATACSDLAFHIDHDQTRDRWDVIDHEGKVIGHCRDQGEAVALAVREAQHAYSAGNDVVVCLEQPDGHHTLAWSP